MIDSKVIKEMAEALKLAYSGTKPYDTTAEVLRIEDGTAWVHIPGGADETPVQMSINAREGDTVRVRVAGGQAWLVGNDTAPPTDDRTANKAQESADAAQETANTAMANAERAAIAADSAEASAAAAQESAEAASTAAEQAVEDAATASAAAAQADAKAEAASTSATAAQASATAAQNSANAANTAANGALNSLSTVQDVMGVLDWAKDNATYTLTSDTEIEPGKTYWTRTGSGTAADPYVYTPVVNPSASALGTYYEISGVDEAMADYIAAHLALTDEGLYVLADGSDWKVLVANDGVFIMDPQNNVVAKYKDEIILGIDDGTQSILKLDYHSIQAFDKENALLLSDPQTADQAAPYFWASDLRDQTGYADIVSTFIADGSTYSFSLSPVSSTTNYTVTVSDGSGGTVTKSYALVSFSSAPTAGAVITVTYKTDQQTAKAYSLGIRGSGTVGAGSVAMGNNCVASNTYSFATGYSCNATGSQSMAGGGNSAANGRSSFAYGTGANARYANSAAFGNLTRATFDNQFVIGQFNEFTDPDRVNAFIIGNGRNNSNRSNAMTVTRDGNIELAIDTSRTVPGSTDYALYEAILALGWQNDVID